MLFKARLRAKTERMGLICSTLILSVAKSCLGEVFLGLVSYILFFSRLGPPRPFLPECLLVTLDAKLIARLLGLGGGLLRLDRLGQGELSL